MSLYQADSRWSSLILGHGPSHIGGRGCVLVSLNNEAVITGARPTMIPPHANAACLQADAFQSWHDGKLSRADELDVHLAATAVGLVADKAPTIAEAGHAVLATALKAALNAGHAMVRVEFPGSRHTILATQARADGGFDCICPAVGRIVLNSALQATAVWGPGDLKTYRVVGVRGIRRPPQ